MNVKIKGLHQIKQGMHVDDYWYSHKLKGRAFFHKKDAQGFIVGSMVIDKELLDNSAGGFEIELGQ